MEGYYPSNTRRFIGDIFSITCNALCHCEERSDVAISRKGHRIIKPTQDTFVLAWRKGAHEQKSEHYRPR